MGIISTKDIWSPYIGEHLTLQCEDSNTHDRHAVCLMKDNCAVGHAPRELSRVFWYFFVMVGCLLYHPLRHRRISSYTLWLVYTIIYNYVLALYICALMKRRTLVQSHAELAEQVHRTRMLPITSAPNICFRLTLPSTLRIYFRNVVMLIT